MQRNRYHHQGWLHGIELRVCLRQPLYFQPVSKRRNVLRIIVHKHSVRLLQWLYRIDMSKLNHRSESMPVANVPK